MVSILFFTRALNLLDAKVSVDDARCSFVKLLDGRDVSIAIGVQNVGCWFSFAEKGLLL